MPRHLEDDTMSIVSQMFKILGDPSRLRILLHLEEQELAVGELAERLNMEQSALSHQLKNFKLAKLVASRKDGRCVYYRLSDDHVFQIIDQAIHHAEEGEGFY